MMGGAVNGGKIHGEHPSDITDDGPYSIGRGRLIPSTSWDSVFNPIAQWMVGVQTEEELNHCLPNCKLTEARLLQKEEVYMALAQNCDNTDVVMDLWKKPLTVLK